MYLNGSKIANRGGCPGLLACCLLGCSPRDLSASAPDGQSSLHLSLSLSACSISLDGEPDDPTGRCAQLRSWSHERRELGLDVDVIVSYIQHMPRGSGRAGFVPWWRCFCNQRYPGRVPLPTGDEEVRTALGRDMQCSGPAVALSNKPARVVEICRERASDRMLKEEAERCPHSDEME